MNSPDQAPGRDLFERWRLLSGVLLLALSFLAYQPGLRGGFIWDDDIYLTGNRIIHAPDGLSRFWFTTEAMDYYPLSSTLLWLEWRIWGGQVAGYRLVNLLLHGISGILLWRILRRGLPLLAWPAAALFILHPVNVEAVAWIAQRKTILASTCALGSVLAWLRAGEGGRWPAYAGSLLLFLASLLSKTTAVALPGALLLLEWGRSGRVTLRHLLRLAPYFALALAFGLVTIWFQHQHAIAQHEVRPESFLSKLAGTGWSAWFYLGKFLFPHPLAICYPRWVIDPAALRAWLPLAAGALLLAALALGLRRWGRWPLALMLMYLSLLAPVLGLVDIGFMLYALAADHWLYVAMPVLCALAALAVRRVAARRPRAVALAALALGVACLALSRRHAAVFSDEFQLWTHNVRLYPDAWMGRLGLANVLLADGKPEEALPLYLRVLELKPDHASTHGNLGALYAMREDAASAERHLRESVRLDPTNPNTRFNLARICGNQGRWREAISNYQATLSYRPEDITTLVHLSGALIQAPDVADRDPPRARELAERACRLVDFKHLRCLEALARAHAACGNPAEARRIALQAAALAEAHQLAAEQTLFEALARDYQR